MLTIIEWISMGTRAVWRYIAKRWDNPFPDTECLNDTPGCGGERSRTECVHCWHDRW